MSILNDISSSDEDASSPEENPEPCVIFTKKANTLQPNEITFENTLISYSQNKKNNSLVLEKWYFLLSRLKLILDENHINRH